MREAVDRTRVCRLCYVCFCFLRTSSVSRPLFLPPVTVAPRRSVAGFPSSELQRQRFNADQWVAIHSRRGAVDNSATTVDALFRRGASKYSRLQVPANIQICCGSCARACFRVKLRHQHRLLPNPDIDYHLTFSSFFRCTCRGFYMNLGRVSLWRLWCTSLYECVSGWDRICLSNIKHRPLINPITVTVRMSIVVPSIIQPTAKVRAFNKPQQQLSPRQPLYRRERFPGQRYFPYFPQPRLARAPSDPAMRVLYLLLLVPVPAPVSVPAQTVALSP